MTRSLLILSVLLLHACASVPVGETADTGSDEASTENRDRENFESWCASDIQPPCRKNVAFTLILDEEGNEKSFHFDLLPPPLQGNDTISIIPGETLFVSGDFVGGKLILPEVAYERPADAYYLEFSFKQEAGKPDMLLVVNNTYDKSMKYRIVMMGPESEQMFKTSSCPVIANGAAYEHWPHPIFQLLVLEVRELNESEGMICVW